MALNKQKILNELGNVVNQLQSADCGCLGKLFSNSNQPNQNAPMFSPMHDGRMRGCCHRQGYQGGCYGPSAGEPFSGNRNCMGHYNAPKLYADTYDYLNNNLMQPVVKEVYDDLKSITPANTMMNNTMGAQMGLSPGNTPNFTAPGAISGQVESMGQNHMPGGAVGNQNAMSNYHKGPNVHFGNTKFGSMQPMAAMPGMGPNIVNMMTTDAAAKRAANPNQGGAQGIIGNNAPQSPEMVQYNSGMPGNNPGQYHNMGMSDIRQGNPVQYMSQPNMLPGANTNMQRNVMDDNLGQLNPGSQQMQSMILPQAQMNSHNPSYGQHSVCMSKFNEMFPGVMNGGDLGFDPMAIAIQMNPANRQRAAMDTMQKMMMGNGKGHNANASLLHPVVNATNTAMANMAQVPTIQAPGQQIMIPTSQQQQIPGANTAMPVQNHQPPQHVYTALKGPPTMNQQQVPQNELTTQQQQYQGQEHENIDPNTVAVVVGTLPTVYEENPNNVQDGSPPPRSASPTTQQMIKEPILPADTSRNLQPAHINKLKHQSYNTLGQPIDLLPVDIYRTPEPNLPQTLSPQSIARNNSGKYSNVKATVSKTSLMGNERVGRTPSKGQLQQIYNQYKGSQSYTQQNIKPSDYGASYSDGHLNVSRGKTIPQAPIEKLGGDTVAIKAMDNLANTAGHKPDQVGDVPAAKKRPADPEKAPINNSKHRNGLQDMKYTAYATSAAWTFHGVTPAPYYSTSYRFQYKA